jgi:hypothetical protein
MITIYDKTQYLKRYIGIFLLQLNLINKGDGKIKREEVAEVKNK